MLRRNRLFGSVSLVALSMILLVVVVIVSAAATNNIKVQRLTIHNYEDVTQEKAIFIRFVTDWCEECEDMNEDFEKLAKDWEDHPIGLVADVFCDTEEGGPLCESFEVAGYPSMYYGDPQSPEIYKGRASYDSMAAFCKENLSSLPCSVSNLSACNDKVKATITKLRHKSREELEEMEEKVLKRVEREQKRFDAKAVELQKKYEAIANDFNAEVDRLRQDTNFKWIQQVLNEMLEAEEETDNHEDDDVSSNTDNNNNEEL